MTAPTVWLDVASTHPTQLRIMWQIPGRTNPATLTPDQARSIVTLINANADARTGGYPHGGIGITGFMLDLSAGEAHELADRLTLLADIAETPGRALTHD